MTALVVRDRRRALLLLAGSLHDLLHQPETSTGALLRKQLVARKDVPDRIEPCHRCGGSWKTGPTTGVRYGVNPGSGLVKSRYRSRRACLNDRCPGVCLDCGDPCEACGGYLETTAAGPVKHPGTGLVAVDSHIEERHRRPLSSDEAGTKPGRVETWLCNVCMGTCLELRERGPNGERVPCRTCGGAGVREHRPFELKVTTATAADPAVVVERAIEHRDMEGSFHDLDVCLDVLRRQAKHRHRVFWDVHVTGVRRAADLDGRQARWLEEAIRDLVFGPPHGHGLMPAEIRVPAAILHSEKARREQLRSPLRQTPGQQVAQAVIEARDAEIRRLAGEEGCRPAELAREFGLSTRQVQRILYGTAA